MCTKPSATLMNCRSKRFLFCFFFKASGRISQVYEVCLRMWRPPSVTCPTGENGRLVGRRLALVHVMAPIVNITGLFFALIFSVICSCWFLHPSGREGDSRLTLPPRSFRTFLRTRRKALPAHFRVCHLVIGRCGSDWQAREALVSFNLIQGSVASLKL